MHSPNFASLTGDQHDKEHEASMVFFCGVQPHIEIMTWPGTAGIEAFFPITKPRIRFRTPRSASHEVLVPTARCGRVANFAELPDSAIIPLRRWLVSAPVGPVNLNEPRPCGFALSRRVGCSSPICGDLELIADSFSNVFYDAPLASGG
jgi:hypothetical protein